MQKILDFFYVNFFGKYTTAGFVSPKVESKKNKYIFDSVFPSEEIKEMALSAIVPNSIISE